MKTTTERPGQIERLITLSAGVFATRLVIGAASGLAMLVGGYYFLVDRTLNPLSERVASLEERANSRLLSLEESMRQQGASLARIEERIVSLSRDLKEDLDRLTAGVAEGLERQHNLDLRLARIESKVNTLVGPAFYPTERPLEVPDRPQVFESFNLDEWTVDVALDGGEFELIALHQAPVVGLWSGVLNDDGGLRSNSGHSYARAIALASVFQHDSFALSRDAADGKVDIQLMARLMRLVATTQEYDSPAETGVVIEESSVSDNDPSGKDTHEKWLEAFKAGTRDVSEVYADAAAADEFAQIHLADFVLNELERGASHPDTLASARRLADRLYDLGRYDDARQFYLKAAQIED